MDKLAGIDLCSIPLGRKADGTWDFVNYQTMEAPSIAICVILVVLATLVAAPRIYVNRRHLLPADYFTILGLIFVVGYAALIILMSPLYRHDWATPACMWNTRAWKIQFCLTFLSGFVQFFPRAAILLLYRQIFHIHSRAIHIAIWVGLVGTFVATFPNIPFAIAVTAPHRGETWAQAMVRAADAPPWQDGRFWGPIQGGFSVVLDIFAFVVPLPIIAKLNLTPRRKKELLFVFSVGFLAVVASIVGFYYKIKLVLRQQSQGGDVMWLLGPVNICIEVESAVAIIVGSMPAFSTFLRQHVAKSTLYRSLRSRFGGKTSTDDSPSKEEPKLPFPPTIGSPFARKKTDSTYHELFETNLIATNITTGGKNGGTTTITAGVESV